MTKSERLKKERNITHTWSKMAFDNKGEVLKSSDIKIKFLANKNERLKEGLMGN